MKMRRYELLKKIIENRNIAPDGNVNVELEADQ